MNKLFFTILAFSVLIACNNGLNKESKTEGGSDVVEVELKEPTEPKETEIWDQKPQTVVPAINNAPPSDAIVLFDGTDMNEWLSAKDASNADWIIMEDGSMMVKKGTGDIQTKKVFGSIQLHLEWKSPAEILGDGQNRGNSGVFLQDKYEVQILDNNDNETYNNGQVASIYKQSIPLAKASVPTGEWNSYDIIYHAPEFDGEGNKTKSGTITVLHNGILVQDHYEIQGSTEFTGWPKNAPHGDGPIRLQDHNCDVSYRNIWVRKL
jgi:hypothetical protein